VIDRVASIASSNRPKSTDAPARNTALSCSRIQARVMTPSVPSEPQKSFSGAGPSPPAGNRRVSSSPAGVMIVSASTCSSMWVGPVA